MPDKPSQVIVKHYCAAFNKKLVGTLFKKELGIANALLKAGFTVEDITMSIDYIKQNPPRDGVRSMAYVMYVINDVLPKAKVKMHQEIQSDLQQHIFVQDEPETDNLNKFNRFNTNNKLRI